MRQKNNQMDLTMKQKCKRAAAVIGCSACVLGGSMFSALPVQAEETGAVIEENAEPGAAGMAQEENASDSGRVVAEENAAEEEAAQGDAAGEGLTAFSVPGNAEVLDHVSDGSTKEFYTIRTANNHTFYLVIDHSSASDNVYMLSAIDEADLQDFIGEDGGLAGSGVSYEAMLDELETEEEGTADPEVSEQQTDPSTAADGAVESKAEEESTAGEDRRLGHLAGLFTGVAILAAACFFLKKKKSAAHEKETQKEGLEYDPSYPDEEEEMYEEDDAEEDIAGEDIYGEEFQDDKVAHAEDDLPER